VGESGCSLARRSHTRLFFDGSYFVEHGFESDYHSLRDRDLLLPGLITAPHKSDSMFAGTELYFLKNPWCFGTCHRCKAERRVWINEN
jgi:hypothetical protein